MPRPKKISIDKAASIAADLISAVIAPEKPAESMTVAEAIAVGHDIDTAQLPPAEEHLDAPAATPPSVEEFAIPERPNVWPEVEQSWKVRQPLSPEKEHELLAEFAKLQVRKEGVESDKAAYVKSCNGQIAKLEEEISGIAAVVRGENFDDVPCRWVFERVGEIGELEATCSFHPQKKVLVRKDHGTVVHVQGITQEDRDGILNFEPSEDECMRVIQECGWELVIDDSPRDGETAFRLRAVNEPHEEKNLPGDNKLDAVRAARLILRPPVSTDPVETAPEQSVFEEAGLENPETMAAELTAEEKQQDAWREEGATAHATGRTRGACPYKTGEPAREFWKAGFEAAAGEVKARVEEAKAKPAEPAICAALLAAIREDGAAAFKDGKRAEDNPYSDNDPQERDAWVAGFTGEVVP